MFFIPKVYFVPQKTIKGIITELIFVAVMILLSLTRDPLRKLILMNTFHGSGNLMYFSRKRFSDILYVMTLLR